MLVYFQAAAKAIYVSRQCIKADRYCVAERDIGGQPGVKSAAFAGAHEDVSLRLESWLLRVDDHCAADGIFTEECTLRAAQHLHVVDVVQVEQPSRCAREEDAIDVGSHARIKGR